MLFSHDGIHDSQTHLSSPSYFYEQLRREILFATRTQKPLALVKILFTNPKSEQVQAHDVLHFAYELTQLTRQEECVGRLGINEVVIIVRDGASHAEQLVQRLLKSTSIDLGIAPIAVFDTNYGTVKSYHKDAWFEAYALTF
jgi:GGDEF domain-containing protein